MIENNPVLSIRAIFGTRDYGPVVHAGRREHGPAVVETTVPFAQSTVDVDNFVGNWVACGAQAHKVNVRRGLPKT
jgi:hypothetical protein